MSHTFNSKLQNFISSATWWIISWPRFCIFLTVKSAKFTSITWYASSCCLINWCWPWDRLIGSILRNIFGEFRPERLKRNWVKSDGILFFSLNSKVWLILNININNYVILYESYLSTIITSSCFVLYSSKSQIQNISFLLESWYTAANLKLK